MGIVSTRDVLQGECGVEGTVAGETFGRPAGGYAAVAIARKRRTGLCWTPKTSSGHPIACRGPRGACSAFLGRNLTSDTPKPNGHYTARWGASRTRHPLGSVWRLWRRFLTLTSISAYNWFAQIGCNNNETKMQGIEMEGLIVIAILASIGYWIYSSGKRTGSRKGYNVGFRRGRRRRR